jgi:hypothetical protein
MMHWMMNEWKGRPPFAAGFCSISTVLLGILLLIWGGCAAVVESGTGYYILSVFRLLAGGLAILAGWGYWRRRTWGVYLHSLSIIHLLVAKGFSYLPGVAFWLTTFIPVASFFLLVGMSCFLKTKPLWIALVLGIGLASASFSFQRTGPSIGIYGTECKDQPHGHCYGPLLGAGFPLQYVLDVPGVSVVGQLGYEDGFFLYSYFLDAAFFAILVFACIRLGGFILGRRRRKEAVSAASDRNGTISRDGGGS